jgi:prevent-host-death family protein
MSHGVRSEVGCRRSSRTTNPLPLGRSSARSKGATEDVQHQSACCTLRGLRTVVGVAEARAQLSDIVAQAANGQVTVIERYGRPTAAVIPFDALESLPDSGVPTDSKPSARHRQAQLLDALARLQEAVEAQTPQDADLIYEALNGAYETSRGRRLER